MLDKPAARSITILAAVLFAVVQTLEGFGVLPAGIVAQLAVVVKGFAGVLGVYGIRRAISTNGLPGLLEGCRIPDEEVEILDAEDDGPAEDYQLTEEEQTAREEADFEEVDCDAEMGGCQESPFCCLGEQEEPLMVTDRPGNVPPEQEDPGL